MTFLEARNQIVQAIHRAWASKDDPRFADALLDPQQDVDFAELKFDSLASMEICMELEDEANVELDLGGSDRLSLRQSPRRIPDLAACQRMIDGIVDAFRQCKTETDFWRVRLKAQHDLTPAEFAELRMRQKDVPIHIQAWLGQLAAIGKFSRNEPVEAFVRISLAEYINLYSNFGVARSSKRLIICFCGVGNQLMLPVPCMLQYLPSERCDVLVLRDPERQYFHLGIRGYESSFLGLLQRLSRDIRLDAYRRVYCYGTSGGGFPALRAGLLLKTDRAISIGGSFPWYISRLQDPGLGVIPAFDAICHCAFNTSTTLLSVFGGGNERDSRQGEKLAAVLPVQSITYPDVSSHNLVLELAETGRLGPFFDRIFEL